MEPFRNRGRLSYFIAHYGTTYGARGARSHDRPPCHGNQAGARAATKYCTAYAYGAIETTEQPPSLLTPSSIDVDRIIIRITLQQTIFSFMTPVTNNCITLHQAIFFRVLAYIKTSNASLHHPTTQVPSDTCDSTDLRQPPKAKSFSQIHLVHQRSAVCPARPSLRLNSLNCRLVGNRNSEPRNDATRSQRHRSKCALHRRGCANAARQPLPRTRRRARDGADGRRSL